jgi:hypothetical protein
MFHTGSVLFGNCLFEDVDGRVGVAIQCASIQTGMDGFQLF